MINWKWHNRFLELAKHVSTWSKDNSTKVGCVIVGRDKRVLDLAYNGFPRGISQSEEREERPLKYSYTQHAERNAIDNCARDGVSTRDAVLYCTLMPCVDCAKSIIQAGIRMVVVSCSEHDRYDFTLTKEMFKESNVDLIVIEK